MPGRIRSFFRRPFAEVAYATRWKLGIRRRASQSAHQAIFTRIHEENEWASDESRSGPGSTKARGADFRETLVGLLKTFSIASVLDAPCGDFNWMRHVTGLLPITYVGVDVVAQLVIENHRLYGDDRHRFLCLDIACDALPAADLILCRDALVHFSFADIQATVANFQRSGSRYLLTTSFTGLSRNEEARTGSWRPLNLEADPFGFPPPIATIEDRPGKCLCLWDLASFRV